MPEKSATPALDALSTDEFDYELPRKLIAQCPAEPRDTARLLVLDRRSGDISHRVFHHLPEIVRSGDLLVANRTRVIPARLEGRRVPSGGRIEALLLREHSPCQWEALIRPGRRLQPGAQIELGHNGQALLAQVGRRFPSGARELSFDDRLAVADRVLALGQPPLPPYIKGWTGDPEQYQTVYARERGSVAAPTAGLHFTPEILNQLRERKIEIAEITLHVGLGTFQPVRVENVEEHKLHSEPYSISAEAAEKISRARNEKRRVVAIGTTTVRTLEYAAQRGTGQIRAGSGEANMFIYPGYNFQVVDALLTNFHLPQSTLLMLVCALAGKENVLRAYHHAVAERYRFYSYGDCMFVE